jgi:hypothetical protein
VRARALDVLQRFECEMLADQQVGPASFGEGDASTGELDDDMRRGRALQRAGGGEFRKLAGRARAAARRGKRILREST